MYYIAFKNTLKRPFTPLLDYFTLFRYATFFEIATTATVTIVLSLMSFCLGLSHQLYAETAGMITHRLQKNTTNLKSFLLPLFGGGKNLVNATTEERMTALNEDIWASACVSLVLFLIMVVPIALSISILNRIALRQAMRIRKLCLRSILSQDMTFFDTKKNLDFASKITTHVDVIRDAIGEKLGIAVFYTSALFLAFIYTCFLGLKLALILLVTFITSKIALSCYMGDSERRLTQQEIQSYTEAGSIAEEVFSNIRTVVTFGGEEKECLRFGESLKAAEQSGIRKSLNSGVQSGFIWLLSYLGWIYGVFLGIHFMILENNLSEDMKTYNVISILTIVSCICQNAQYLAFARPSLDVISTAIGTAGTIYDIIQEKSDINPLSKYGLIIDNFKGDVEFRSVSFRYPSRETEIVLKNVSFKVKKGQSVALVGQSGCGKSTCLQLLQRFYDVNEMGIVGQEPVLFSTTIAENIRLGKPEATQDEIEYAAKIANCHNFIRKLPQMYKTLVGENGAQLSGGQKQRIAIARALVKNPKILLLDEVTSALDSDSESNVQEALSRAMVGRTTFIISHKLSNIRNVDQIIVFNQCRIAEKGTHEDLLQIKGLYYQLHVANYENKLNNEGESESRQVSRDPDSNSKFNVIESSNNRNSKSDQEVNSGNKIKASKNNTIFRILKLSSDDGRLMISRIVWALLLGLSCPIETIFYSHMVAVFQYDNIDEMYSVATHTAIILVIMTCILAVATMMQTFLTGKAGVRLTSHMRKLTFRAILKQEMGWFDCPENSVGSLTSRLSSDCANIQEATGTHLAGMTQAATTVLIGLIIALVLSWKLTVIASIALPMLLSVVYFDAQYSKRSAVNEKKAIENASRIAVEAIIHIRTLASLGQEQYILDKYDRELEIAEKEVERSIRFRGLVFSLNMTVRLLAYSIGFLSAGRLISKDDLSFADSLTVIEVIVYGAWMTGMALNNSNKTGQAITSAVNIFSLIDRKPKIVDSGSHIESEFEGNVSFKDVKFHYPTRPDVQILKGLNLSVLQGKTVALVGSSGCGKSTCIQLLLRFYDPVAGKIALDSVSTQDYSLERLRAHVGLVSQEPVLFDRTIAENIAYGDNSRDVPLEEIIEAAKEACIHSEYVTKLPLGYDTPLGPKGSHVSGGQKQRIAIARALLRKPKILLLDEATSALDAENAQMVQMSLKRACKNRTCVLVAHRLSSVQNADQIFVIKDGLVAEAGTHTELLNAGGIYCKILQKQF